MTTKHKRTRRAPMKRTSVIVGRDKKGRFRKAK